MCGIVGYVGKNHVLKFLLSGLYSLEYRGYDSAGIAIISDTGALEIVKRAGSVAVLDKALQASHIDAHIGIGHTRWATHGEPSEINAHPHTNPDKTLAIVHNGIIENHYELRSSLECRGYVFQTETDTEVVAFLLDYEYKNLGEQDLTQALINTCKQLKGAYALGVCHKDYPDELFAARNGSPLVCAQSEDGAYLASDMIALAPYVDELIVLDNGQFARLCASGSVTVFDGEAKELAHHTMKVDANNLPAASGEYPDFMLKEINEQADIARRLVQDHYKQGAIVLDGLNIKESDIQSTDKIFIVACGSSYHAALIAKSYIEGFSRIPVEVSVASEFNYRDVLVSEHTLCIVVTQSGETADTLSAARKIKRLGAKVFAITNVIGSTAAREADGVLYTNAGPEVSVAATKTYFAQVLAMYLLAIFLGDKKATLKQDDIKKYIQPLLALPEAIETIISNKDSYEACAEICKDAHSALFIGRGLNYSTASEGALKLKEISYLHAESYPAGEMKHGPIALLEPGFPVVVVIPQDETRDKTLSNIEEIMARGAQVCAVCTQGDEQVAQTAHYTMGIPSVGPLITPLVAIIPLQIFARKVAINRGQNVDRPRNLAKSVTVE